MVPRPVEPDAARAVVTSYEQSLSAAVRRRDGVHYTPPAVAAPVLELALDALGGVPRTVCDPTCGGGAFLLTVADRLLAAGVPAGEVVRHRLVGHEVDPEAVGVARRALSRWADDHGASVQVDDVRVHQVDTLSTDPSASPDRPRLGFDMVIGNPPFLNQLSRRTARSPQRRELVAARFGQVGAYADDAGLFLLAATDLAAPGGVVAMLQPQSLLSARDGATVRRDLLERADLVGLWADGGTPFVDADVHVCAPVLRRHRDPRPGERHSPEVEVLWQLDGTEHRSRSAPPTGDTRWGALLGAAHGVPPTPTSGGAPLSSVATATAGFRDEFYALCEAMVPDVDPGAPVATAGPRLVTVGMVDPLSLRWASARHRLGGRAVMAPRLDTVALAATSPRVARWVRGRLGPKVLVATQTKVIEAVADPDGSCVPVTPTICVEPIRGLIDVWHLVAALSAPPVAAAAVRDHLGAGRSTAALRWSAKAALDTPLPVDGAAWDRGAQLAMRWHLDPSEPSSASPDPGVRAEHLAEFGAVMTIAHGLDADDPVVSWWSERLPRR